MSSDVAAELAGLAGALLTVEGPQGYVPLTLEGAALRTIDFRPHDRPGLRLGTMSSDTRKLVLRMVADVLSPHTFVQVAVIMGLEAEVSRSSQWRKWQQPDDYYFAIFGDPTTERRWAWRLEGHHVSVSVVVDQGAVTVGPIFLGANPDCLMNSGIPVLWPLAPERALAREIASVLNPAEARVANVSTEVPPEIRFGDAPYVDSPNLGLRSNAMSTGTDKLVRTLMQIYLNRLSPRFSKPIKSELERSPIRFAYWGDMQRDGAEFHYIIDAGSIALAEYGINSHGEAIANHSHSVLRRPRDELGGRL